MKKINLIINEKKIEADEEMTVFQAAQSSSVFIPHYCYHPDLSIAGVCRMCVVEIEKLPRLQISCNTRVSEGMVVKTDTEKVKDAVKSCLELHLINHPLDCPICDKSGECKLQDFYASYGLYASRMEYEKVHKPKVVDIGTIVLDEERCILCTRCVRFTDEVTHTRELGIFNRGDRAELKTYDNGPLRNDYTGNLADICPVGALTSKDFRFQCRVWFLEKTESVCTLCARGCNTTVSVSNDTQSLYRIEPRRNPEVNKSWICDKGRWDYHYVMRDSRIRVPLKRESDFCESTWNEVFSELSTEIVADPKKVAVGLSAYLTNEEIIDAVRTLTQKGVEKFFWIVDEKFARERTPCDGILKHADETPNSQGLERILILLNQKFLRPEEFQKKQVERLICLGCEGETIPGLQTLFSKLGKTTKIAVHATNQNSLFEVCDWILPNVSSYEKNGTVVNALGRLQKLNGPLPPRFTSRNTHQVLYGLENGNDRMALPAGRVAELYESFVREKMLQDSSIRWRSFPPLGIHLERS